MNESKLIGQLLRLHTPPGTKAVTVDSNLMLKLAKLMWASRDSRAQQAFMEEVWTHYNSWKETDIAWCDMVADDLTDPSISGIFPPGGIGMTLYLGNQLVDHLVFDNETDCQSVTGLHPGDYLLELDTGLVIWQECIGEQELLWATAFPERPLDMAADTGDTWRRSSREWPLFSQQGHLRLFPHIETGTLEIDLI